MYHMLGSAHGSSFFWVQKGKKNQAREGKVIQGVVCQEGEYVQILGFGLLLYGDYSRQDLTNNLSKPSAYMNS